MNDKKLIFILGLFVLLTAVFLSELLRHTGPSRVVFILLDAARADRFSTYGYKRQTTPNMDRLAKRGAVFLNHFAQATFTRMSIPSIFYSRYFPKALPPPIHRATNPEDLFQDWDSESVSLPGILSANGYWTCSMTASPWLGNDRFIGKEFDEVHNLYADPKFAPDNRPSASFVIDHSIQWIRKKRNRKFFLYIHLMDTHFPHFLEQDAKQFLKEDGTSAVVPDRFHVAGFPKDNNIELSPLERKYLDAIYDGDLHYADRELGRLFQSLNEDGMLEKSLIVITADHGEELLELPGRWAHEGRWSEPVARVPLIVFYPKELRPERAHFMTEGVDIVPTILGLMNIHPQKSEKFDGTNLIKTLEGKSPPKKYVYAGNWMRDARHKCFYDISFARLLLEYENQPPTPISAIPGELYDLTSDPGETKNLWKDHPETVAEMLNVYRKSMRERFIRKLQARTRKQPEFAFSIGVTSFKIKSNLQTEWTREDYLQIHSLSGGPGAHAELEFQLPNGFYLVSALGLGSADLKLKQAGDWIPIRSQSPFGGPKTTTPTEELRMGTVQITDEVFRAEIRIPDHQSFLITRFVFFPRQPMEKKEVEIEREAEEQLRALGYIQ